MAGQALVANIDVFASVGVCAIDIKAILASSLCKSVEISLEEYVQVDVHPETICVTPTLPTTTSTSTASLVLVSSTTTTTSTVTTTPLGSTTTSERATTTTTSTTTSPARSLVTTSAAPTTTINTAPPGTTQNEPSPRPVAPYCSQSFVDIVVDLTTLNLDVDIDIYLRLAGLLDSAVDILGGLFGPPSPRPGSSAGAPPPPTQLSHNYRPRCGKSFARHGGGAACSARDHADCLWQCERAAVEASVRAGALVDCLGATVNNGLQVENCLYFVGSEDIILDAVVDLVIDDEDCDSFAR